MAKVDQIREKFPRITQASFNKFVSGDTTPTKKYLEYMCSLWVKKLEGNQQIKSAEYLVSLVKLFDTLLPYNNINRDIYSKQFGTITNLQQLVTELIQIKEDKEFIREDHVDVLWETDDYLMVRPKTHVGSLKYGSNTRWCTASKNNPSTFTSYTNGGLLVYLIDKKNSKGSTYSKIAFYERGTNMFTGSLEVFNQSDNSIQDGTIIENGWSEDVLIEAYAKFRVEKIKYVKLKKSMGEVQRVVNLLSSFNIDEFKQHLSVIKNTDTEKHDKAQEMINNFLNVIQDFKI
jgi:hypothetical protein